MDFMQLYSRIKLMNLQFNDKNFSYIEQEPDKRKLNMMDLKLEFQTFAYEKNGKFIVVDMFSGIDLNNGYNLNDYQDMGQYVLPQFREICKKYGFTILLIHHLNKNNSSLGSTAIDGSVDGIFTLKKEMQDRISFCLLIFQDYVSCQFLPGVFHLQIQRLTKRLQS